MTEAVFEEQVEVDSLAKYLMSIKIEYSDSNYPVVLAYRGVAEAISAEEYFWPWDKLNTLDDGLEIIDDAVLLDSTNIEIRLLRFYVLDNVPSIIGYSDDAKSELNTIYSLAQQTNGGLDRWVGTRVIKELIKGELIDSNETNQMRERILQDNE